MPAGLVDLRSDTVTQPTPAMRTAMADADVGDDGYGEDPTVRALEEAFAERVGKQAAVLVPSGTMANQIALRLLGTPGSAVLAGQRSHVVAHEAGAAGVNGWAQLVTVDDTDGTIAPEAVEWQAEAGAEHHWLPLSAVFVEDTHMASGGRVWPVDRLRAVADLGFPVHLDGARLFNASVASGVPVAERAAPATTLMCCMSKGLGAPVGSLLAGDAEAMLAARAERKRLGGAMRQAGVFAAAALVALRDHVERLAEDHARAQRLADVVGVEAETNLVVFRHDDPPAILEHLRANGVLAGTIAPGTIRLATHLDIDDDDVETACKALASAP